MPAYLFAYLVVRLSQGGYFGKKFWSCRPDAGPEQFFGDFAGRTPVRRRFAGFAGIPKFPDPRIPRFSDIPRFSEFAGNFAI